MEFDFGNYNYVLKWSYEKAQIKEAFDSQYKMFFDVLKNNAENRLEKDMTIKENTLIHGTSYDEKKLLSIKESGIISGDFFGVEEKFDECRLCADFFRIDKDLSLFEFFLQMNGTRDWTGTQFLPIKPLGAQPTTKEFIDVSNCRLPFLKTDASKNNVAFLINGNNNIVKQFQKYDYYRNPHSIMSKIVFEKNLKCFYKPEMSAVLFGLPSNLISAIVVGSNIESDENKLKFLQNTFENVVIFSANGKILYVPEKQKNYYDLKVISNNFNKELKNFAKNDLQYAPKSVFVDIIASQKEKEIEM